MQPINPRIPQNLKLAKIDWSKVENPEFVFQRFPSRRSVVYGTKGVISSPNPLATEAGLGILRQGGNAGTAKPLQCYLSQAEKFGILTKVTTIQRTQPSLRPRR
jgi:hypothetical protein